MTQLKLDFSRPSISIDSGKKTERITITASSDLKEFIDLFAVKLGLSVSELGAKYFIEGLQRDLGSMLLIQANEQKTLADLLKK